jgi:heme exporter protein B
MADPFNERKPGKLLSGGRLLHRRRGGVLLSLLVLPLFIPVLIFGVGAVEAAIIGMPARPHLLLLLALLLAAIPLAPIAAAAALRQAVE